MVYGKNSAVKSSFIFRCIFSKIQIQNQGTYSYSGVWDVGCLPWNSVLAVVLSVSTVRGKLLCVTIMEGMLEENIMLFNILMYRYL